MHVKVQKIMGLIDLTIVVLMVAWMLGIWGQDDMKPVVAFVIFFSVLVNIIIFWRHRIPIVLLAIGALLALRVLTVDAFIDYAHINVIAFLLGMMIVVAFLEDRGFFDALLSILISRFGGNAKKFFVATMILAAIFASLVGEVSSILFMCAIMLKAAKKYDTNPTPFIMSVVFATNVGSAFTLLGNPVGVLMSFEGGLTFMDFIIWALPTGLLVLGVTLALTIWLFRKDIAKMDEGMRADKPVKTTIYNELLGHAELRVPVAIFSGTLAGLVLQRPLEEAFGIETNVLLLAIPIVAAALSLLYGYKDAGEVVEKRVQWSTLVFFIFFFGVTGALQYSGVTQIIASRIMDLTGGNMALMIIVFLWFAGIMSAFMDNVLAVATIIPIVASISGNFPLWWAVLFGACFMGNLTIIGSSANIVAHTYYEKNGGRAIGFFEWLKPGLVVALAQMATATVLTVVLHVYMFPR